MTYKIKISEEAELDLNDAYQWYESQVKQLGSELIRVVDKNLALIQKNPLAYPIIYNNVRRKLLPRFPYGLFYVIHDDIIFILAFFHVKRDPQQWKKRF
ncbi:type II toxin-antitoxin system RelE/ParE family toxin [Planktothrix mougeotii]|uniref:Type II toxin-antitoxin system RelE/ParE family toxin n=1 Tax=Planktothrix mougeotii LEGE 06226 TaxID=1828728 RepID=A0ABR9UKS8_9CYAN|nr:type II toxin-antitoxin system RelE/ParE family toxin [Planktothrix mougeotii]MBE9146771.1 type II toxin-antitoxin system RelE/ParE family toxin [Planktothrix mougeotii LEGE 06226]